ncbi:NADPH-dependent ferric siderophore reductase, contains FAD-binding and SIP domains [Quadrisphaera granulorum]|uniref:NADPH-dependent ferric siderophore reductase n=1 Tax=Quadrisphaera granulorum TaxID=317664 RepID=A0A316ABU7_9ACTN|nr:siderophore-interacting protein [Quadrisphaera granulorum]PWJ54344.1 NADPH-dependent ferric siderophore reductase [Quadrisphaera granulorum]SZE96116.1 NADPH-dependent ferric siderophore reductase, contains FAD-binding and SIP domains [Quadrisphaera granulorum]
MAVSFQRTVMRAIGAREQRVTVTAAHDVLDGYRRVSFSAPEVMASLDIYPTAWVRLWVPSLTDPRVLKQRGFTLVNPDPKAGTFDLEFVIHHPTGPEASWALAAEPGEEVEIAVTPTAWSPDPEVSRYALVGDASCIPAFVSILGALPPGAEATVLFAGTPELAQLVRRTDRPVDLQVFPSGTEQVTALRQLDPDGLVVWCAGERRDVAAVRDLVRRDWAMPRHRRHTRFYWMADKPFG